MTQSWAQAARLVRCTGFGATGTEVDAAARLDRSTFVNALFAAAAPDPGAAATPVPTFAPIVSVGKNPTPEQISRRNRQITQDGSALVQWWLSRMTAVQRPFVERLTLAWHGIFATSIQKVRRADLMALQNTTLRNGGTGGFRALALAVLTDPAMIIWLDGQDNTKAAPNENLAREFMELFALGHGNGYTEDDVRQGARALTGWKVDDAQDRAYFDAARHDDGIKTFLGATGNLDLTGYCDAVLAMKQSAPFVLGRLWNQLVSDQPMDAATSVAAVSAFGSGRDAGAAIMAMLSSSGFDRAVGTRVVSPVEWAVGLARAVNAPVGTATASTLAAVLSQLGQVPFEPPSVGGWNGGQAWLSSAALTGRWDAGQEIIALGHIDPVTSSATSARLDAVAHLLGIPTWSDHSAAALEPFVAQPTQLVAAAAMTPEYLTV